MQRITGLFLCIVITLGSCEEASDNNQGASKESFNPTWESLSKHNPEPDWFRDAKFGIYFHWGVYSVPAYGSEWYPRNMYIKEHRVYEHHTDTYGSPIEFEYADLSPGLPPKILMLKSGLLSSSRLELNTPVQWLSITMDFRCGTARLRPGMQLIKDQRGILPER